MENIETSQQIFFALLTLMIMIILIRRIQKEIVSKPFNPVENYENSQQNVLAQFPFKLRTYLNNIIGSSELLYANKDIDNAGNLKIYLDNILISSNDILRLAKNMTEQMNTPEKSTSLNILSFELRTGMQTIVGFTALIQESKTATTKQQKQLLDMIQSSTKSMHTLLDAISELAQVEANNPEPTII